MKAKSKQTALCCFPKNHWGNISGFAKELSVIPARLLELGLLPNTKVRVLTQAPFKGPIVIEYGNDNSRMMLREEEAQCFYVEENSL